jgi:predicted  nucleic acid-binding Zn-ribbon protein
MAWLMENFKVVQWVMWLLFGLVVWALAVTFVKKKHHSELANRVNEIELTYNRQQDHEKLNRRVNTLETKVNELPDKTTIHRVESEVKELKGQIDGVEKLLSHISTQVGMLVENEITNK